MVEPQDPKRSHNIVSKRNEAIMAIQQLNSTLPEEFQVEAQNSLDELVSFRAEIHKDITELQE